MTPAQEEYFKVLESLNPGEQLLRSIAVAKENLRLRSADPEDDRS